MKEKFGQYMTPKIITDFMVELINKDVHAKVLEPASGQGAFIESLKAAGFSDITAYEIDEEMIGEQQNILHQSFVSAEVEPVYDVVIGNPPYIRWKNLEAELKEELYENALFHKYLNSLNDYSAIFILKAVEALREEGELIFITPDYWMDTTHSLNMRNYLLEHGCMTDLYIFKEAKIFKNVTVSTMVFKYKKTKESYEQVQVHRYTKQKEPTKEIIDAMLGKAVHEDVEHSVIAPFEKDKKWVLAGEDDVAKIELYEQACSSRKSEADGNRQQADAEPVPDKLEDFCEIGNGMVSGLDKAFQIAPTEFLTETEMCNLIKVIKAKDLEGYRYKTCTDYIFANEIQTEEQLIRDCPNYYRLLSINRDALLKRYNYNRDIPYWAWVFLRNYNLFSAHDKKIFVPCKERISNKDYHRFTVVYGDIYPTQDVTAIIPKETTEESIEYICAMLNSKYVFSWVKHKGIVKGNIVEFSRAPLARIPYKKIDFDNPNEKALHDRITENVKAYLGSGEQKLLQEIEADIDKLIQG